MKKYIYTHTHSLPVDSILVFIIMVPHKNLNHVVFEGKRDGAVAL
jgi:hypothetical protein